MNIKIITRRDRGTDCEGCILRAAHFGPRLTEHGVPKSVWISLAYDPLNDFLQTCMIVLVSRIPWRLSDMEPTRMPKYFVR